MDKIDLPKLNIQPSASLAQNIFGDIEQRNRETMRAIEASHREKARHEAEKRADLKRIADNSEETVLSLRETNAVLRDSNDVLKENNRLLKEKNEELSVKLSGLNELLEKLIQSAIENGEDAEEMMRQSLALQVEISKSLDDSNKFDWKGTLANASISAILTAIQMYLKI